MSEARILPNCWFDPPGFSLGCDTQDDVLTRVFEIIGIGNKTLLDVGTGDSWHDGTVHRGFPFQGWKVLGFEQKTLSAENLCNLYRSCEAQVERRTLNYPGDATFLDQAITSHFGETRLDLLGIRLRGPDWQAWEHLNHRPRVVAVQFNPSIPPIVEYVQEDGVGINKGASLLALKILGEERGYDLAHVGRLAIFVNKEEASRLDLGDTAIERMWDGGEWQTRVMVGMDGTLVVGGNNRLLWNRIGEGLISFDQEDVQPLLKSFRRLEW